MCLEEAGFPYVLKDQTELPTGYPTFAMPILRMPDGTAIAQQNAICGAIGRASGLYPKGAANEAIGWNVMGNSVDLFSEVYGSA